MNIDDVEKAVSIKKRIENNRNALVKAEDLLYKNPNGNSDGTSVSSDGKIYSLHIGEYRDGSGEKINLTGSMIQTEVLKFVISKLKEQIEKDLALIKSL